MKVRAALVVSLLLATCAPSVRAQPVPDTVRTWRTASLVGWYDEIRTSVLDRRHAYGGLFFDRGVFRRLTPAMDHEYDMDLLTYGYTGADDIAWYSSDHAVRTYMGSIHKSRFATRTRTRHKVALTERSGVLFSAMQQEDLAAQRFFVEISYGHDLGDAHRLGFRQTVAAYKPDLDLTLFWTWTTPTFGALQVETVLLDAANNLIFDRLGTDPVLEDTVRSYRRRPFLLDAYWRSPSAGGFRGEVAVGIQPLTTARVRSQGASSLDFTWNERLHYAAALVEYRHRLGTGGLQIRHTFSTMERSAAADSPYETDYGSTQSSRSATLYLLAPVWNLRTAFWMTGEFYSDVQEGAAFDEASIASALDYFERRLTLQARLQYVPPDQGIRGGVDYLVDGRTFYRGADLMNSYLEFLPWSPNGRLAVHAGYQFSPDMYVLIGGAYDLGGDPFYDDRGPVRYDGGFGRAVLTW